MSNWESNLRKPVEGEQWSSMDVLAEVVRGAIEYENIDIPVHDPQPKSENSLEKSISQKTTGKNKKNLGLDQFDRNEDRSGIQETLQGSSSSLSSSPKDVCSDCFKCLLELGDDSGKKEQFNIRNLHRPRCGTISSSASSSRELPVKVQDLMRDMNGVDPKLIIHKTLTKTDVSENHGRLSIPQSYIKDKDFLNPEEERIIDKRCRGVIKIDLGVIVIDPLSRKWNMNLRKWEMPKKSGNSSSIFVLVTEWKNFVIDNGLKEGDEIELWTFRSQQKLHFCFLSLEQGSGNSGQRGARSSAERSF